MDYTDPPEIVDPAGPPIGAQSVSPKRPSLPPKRSVTAVVSFIVAGLLWKFSMESLVITVALTCAMACAFLWLLIDLPPWVPEVPIRQRYWLTAAFAVTFCLADAAMFWHGDFGEPAPNFKGRINSSASLIPPSGDPTFMGPTYVLDVSISNSGSPSYTDIWGVYFINANGLRTNGRVFPAPSEDHPMRKFRIITRSGMPLETAYTRDSALVVISRIHPIEHDGVADGLVLVAFPPDGPQPNSDLDIRLTVTDRLGHACVMEIGTPSSLPL